MTVAEVEDNDKLDDDGRSDTMIDDKRAVLTEKIEGAIKINETNGGGERGDGKALGFVQNGANGGAKTIGARARRRGIFSKVLAWVAKGSEKASKSGMLCSS